jgi:hypothetical protein
MGRKEKRALRRLAEARADIKKYGERVLKFDSNPRFRKFMEAQGSTRENAFGDLLEAKERRKMNKEILREDAYREGQRDLDLGPDLPYEQPDGSSNGFGFVDQRRRDRNRQQKLVNKSQRNRAIQGLKTAMTGWGLDKRVVNKIIQNELASAVTELERHIQATNPSRLPVQITHRMAHDWDTMDLISILDKYEEYKDSEKELDAADQALIYERDVAEPARRRVVQDALGFITRRIVDADAGIQPTPPGIPYGQPLLPPPGYVDPSAAAFAAARSLPPRPPMSEQAMIDAGFAVTRQQARDDLRGRQEERQDFIDAFYG